MSTGLRGSTCRAAGSIDKSAFQRQLTQARPLSGTVSWPSARRVLTENTQADHFAARPCRPVRRTHCHATIVDYVSADFSPSAYRRIPGQYGCNTGCDHTY
jgi:hypothetical protein